MSLSKEQIEKFTNAMRKAAANYDTEISHEDMDGVLLEIAEAVGCKEAVKIFIEAKKHY